MCLPAAELRDQCQHGSGAFRLAGKPPKDHPCVFAKSAGKASTFKKLFRILIILRRRAGHDLFQGDRKLIGIEGTAFADLSAWSDDFVPGFHIVSTSSHVIEGLGVADFSRRYASAFW